MSTVKKILGREVAIMWFGRNSRSGFFDMLEDGRHDAVSRTVYRMSDGSERTTTEIKPSASGAKAGAAAGAVIGSAVPVVGTAAGALVGGIVGFIFGPAD